MTTSHKLWLGFGTLTALLVLFCAMFLLQVRSIKARVGEQANVARPRSVATREMEINVISYALAVRTFTQTYDPMFRRVANERAADVEKHVAEYERFATTEGQRELIARFTVLWREYKDFGQANLNSKARPLPLADLERLVELRIGLEKFLDEVMQVDAIKSFDASRDATFQDLHRVTHFVLALLIVGGSVAVATSVAVGRGVVRSGRVIWERTQALQASEQRFRAIVNSQFQFIGLLSLDGVVLETNETALAIVGVTKDQVVGKPFWETAWWVHDPAVRDRHRDAVARAAAGEQVRFETQYTSAGGGLRWVDYSLTPFRDETGTVAFLIPEGHDITEQKRTEDALRLQEEEFRSAFDHAPIGVALIAPNGKWLRVNRSLCEIVGYSEGELLAIDFQTITHPEDVDADLGYVRDVLAGGIKTYQMEKRYIHKDGHVVYILLSATVVRDAKGKPLHFIKQIADITQRKEAGDRINASLREKETLLKEIHHRVKNNLQIVSTLLDLQSDHTQDRQALEMFKESRGRVKSMALIHERLYRSQDLARVNFAEYVKQLAEDLYRTYKVSNDDIVLHVEVAIPPLPIDIAIPCGLLMNELMSNCFKHGFKDASEGWIRVTLCGDGPNNVLTVADNGAGLPPGFDFRNTASFGLQLVTTLVEQLQGKIELNGDRGSEFVITFPMKIDGHNGTQR